MVYIHTDKSRHSCSYRASFCSRRPPTVGGGEGQWKVSRAAAGEDRKARDSLRFSHIILTKCHKGLEANKKATKQTGAAVAKHLLREGERKIQNNSRLCHPNAPTPSSPDLQRGDGEGQIRGFNSRGSEPFAVGAGGRRGPELRMKTPAEMRSQTAAWSLYQAECVGGRAVRQTHPEHCESAQLSQRHLKQKQKNKKKQRGERTTQTRLNSQETYFVAAAKVGKCSQITWRNTC